MEAEAPSVFTSFGKPIRRAIAERGFPSPTEPQVRAIPPIIDGKNILLVAPTGTGKTEAAFLPILNALYTMPERPAGIKAIYITPLRALNRDLLERLEWWCKRLDIRLAVRHGDTDTGERGRQALVPPDILITTPETLQAILPGWVMRRHLREVRWVIVDEVHELAGEKRGSQLSIALERLRYITERDFQVIGLSATIGTPEKVAHFLVGKDRPIEIVKAPVARFIELTILYPEPTADDYALAEKLYTYPAVASRLRVIKDHIDQHTSTLLFTNTRTEAEILASRFRVWNIDLPIGVHHGSLSKPTRIAAERDLKEGRLHSIICTSSLELGIDVGLLDQVIQYNSPRQVTRLLQRVGRSGHRIGGVAKGIIITQDSDDALEALVIARRAFKEDLEPVEIPAEPYDALIHQLVGLLLHKSRWYFEEALRLVRNAYPYRDLTEAELERVLTYMHNRYPRLAWVSFTHKIFTKPQNVKGFYDYYFQNLSMIPEEKQFLVVQEDRTPIGVLDEAFVAEHGEIGTKFIVSGRPWKIQQIFKDKIYVIPEEDPTGAIPSWVGEEIPVPYDVAMEVGTIRRQTEERLQTGFTLDGVAAELVRVYPTEKITVQQALREIAEHVQRGIPTPTDQRITIERWQEYIVIQCCFGHQVNRTLSRVLAHVLSEKIGAPVGAQQDPYRVVLKTTDFSLEEIRQTLLDLTRADLPQLAVQAITKTGMFKRRFIHVAKKCGALAKDADLSSTGLTNLIETFKDTAVYEEAVKTALHSDADLARTQTLLGEIKAGHLQVELIDPLPDATPTARIGLRELAWKSDLVPPDRLRRLLIESTRARLLSEARTVVCTHCWNYITNLRIADLLRHDTCPECGSSTLGLADEAEEKVRQLAEKVHMGRDTVPQRYRRLYKRVLGTAQLFTQHKFTAAMVLAAKGLRLSDAQEILKEQTVSQDKFVELILDAERKALKRRFLA